MNSNNAKNDHTSDRSKQAVPIAYWDAISRANHLVTQLPMLEEFEIDILIRNYPHFIENYFKDLLDFPPQSLCENAKIPYAFGFYHFGLTLKFKSECTLNIHSESMELCSEIKKLVSLFGVVCFENAVLDQSISELYHLNNFAHLNFHRDRNDAHENRYSLYTRSPSNEEQYYPRSASTLFIDNSVAYLQACVEGLIKDGETGRRGHYEIFKTTNLNPLFGKLILDHRWDAPEGQGEIVIINNNSVLHSSYKRSGNPGYPIGARYLY